jgi:hypothetical protein
MNDELHGEGGGSPGERFWEAVRTMVPSGS